MKRKNIVIACLAVGVLGAAGWGLYRLGMHQGMAMTLQGPVGTSTTAQPQVSTSGTVDPSTWGIPEGIAATRRHIQEGIKAGVVDPVTGRKVLYYHDPMVPGKKFEAPGKSPFMDMMLVPAYAGGDGADASTVTISPRIQQNLGLRTGEVTEGTLASEVSAAGAIAWNERDQAMVQARAMGYVEKLHVRATLDRVAKGQALFDIYVPDWVAVQEDFLSVRRMQGSDLAPLVDAARQRMRQAGMNQTQIGRVEQTGVVQARTTLTSPISGVLAELAVREGSTAMPGMTLARINGLSTVWAEAQVPESQAARMRVGAPVTARSPALPDTVFEGRVQALLPEVNAATRTLKVRMELRNPGGKLVPGMFVQMVLSDSGKVNALWVPTEALIRTGKRTLVMVAEKDGAFRPVEVEAGQEAGDRTEIRRGLQAGQKVVLSGQFLIDSEAGLKGVEARLGAPVPATATDRHRTTARIEAVNGAVLTLSHPAIPTLKWPAMTMDFKLAPDLQKSGLGAGQEVEVEFRMREGDDPQIVTLRRIDGKGAAR
ncbi:MAG: efflux RND transporter periplasmic adaptor subunit [Betaproteobacteria bacterium HGW-Betaproteobacteria-3]|jgi:Cu(I)/Ag(I) efflux system membrane fusion protein|nr:MAG: efflux RND transporter periplasmic adaptor subunit [Betaproteobacteria bacterium HGW-Betaproteobacteria-3]